ncbi:bifunctional transcriptional activator/DNA repair enzyme AdaA [Paenibacillus sp. HB172176]|uniref:bifunctional transcriptional activator/DNA repair enzyme AdaA n=1 Tax=Paenibacillus sp. HB172176 TaxID=2493690 RepID=UPI00143A6A15|nr:bifunctional transcriptional activator/DNA repair enzyme AdaA [Paenibacillus sp. HB172176]
MNDEQWEAVVSNNAEYDGKFFYAVKTTGIFCRPSCKSKEPRRDNVRVYGTAAEAMAEGFRPCKRCRPTGSMLPDEEWVDMIKSYMDRNFQSNLNLSLLAEETHGTPFHLHRIFKRVTGLTPMAYAQQVRVAEAKTLLTDSQLPIAEVGGRVGISNAPYFITLFKKLTGLTPEAYRRQQQYAKEAESHDNEQ